LAAAERAVPQFEHVRTSRVAHSSQKRAPWAKYEFEPVEHEEDGKYAMLSVAVPNN
jgi:hypothetical protein